MRKKMINGEYPEYELTGDYDDDFDEKYNEEFDDENESVLNVGVVGYSVSDFDEVEAKVALENIFDEIESDYITNGDHRTIRIISGGTLLGIPKLAYEIATARGYETMAIIPEQAKSYDLYDVDNIVWVGEKFGDESEAFVEYLDVFVKIGGGDQSNAEAKMADEKNIPVHEFDL